MVVDPASLVLDLATCAQFTRARVHVFHRVQRHGCFRNRTGALVRSGGVRGARFPGGAEKIDAEAGMKRGAQIQRRSHLDSSFDAGTWEATFLTSSAGRRM